MAYNSSILEALLNPSAYAMRNAAQGPAPWMAWAGNGQQRPAMPMQQGQQPMRPQGPAPQQGQPMQPMQQQQPAQGGTDIYGLKSNYSTMPGTQDLLGRRSQLMQQPATTPVATAPFQPVAQVPMNQTAPGGQSPHTSQILGNWNAGQAAIAADSERRRQEFEAQQAAQQAQAAASAPWEIAHGVAPHQVKGRSPQDVQIMQQEARNVDDWYNRLPNQPPPVSDVGFSQRPGLGMRPEDAARLADERAMQQQNRNWDTSKSTPNYDLTKISVPLPSPGEGDMTLDGMRAAQSRSLQQDPRYREYMAKAKEEKARRDRGEDAVSPGPLKIARERPNENDVIDTMLGRMKYGDYQQQMGERRVAAKEKNAKEKAARHEAVVNKSKAKAAGMNVPNFERLQAVADSMRQQQQMTAQAWENIQSGQGTAGDYIVVGGTQAGSMAPENRVLAVLHSLATGNQSNPNGIDPALVRSILAGNMPAGGGLGVGDMGGGEDVYGMAIESMTPEQQVSLAAKLKAQAESTGDPDAFAKWKALDNMIQSQARRKRLSERDPINQFYDPSGLVR